MTQRVRLGPIGPLILLFIILFLFAACGDSGESSSATAGTTSNNPQAADAPAGAEVPATMPAPEGNFTAVGEQSGLTDTAQLTTTQSITAVGAGTVNLEVGVRAYDKNKCADCHGPKGEGVADKGKAIAGTALSLDEFDKLLRTGGGLGNSHIFGRSAVSPTGMEALHAYVQSLK